MISLDDILFRAYSSITAAPSAGLGGIKLSDIHFRSWDAGEEIVVTPDPPPEPPPDPVDPGDFGATLEASRPRIGLPDGDDYYISPFGSDNTGTGTFANPWRTPNKAFDVVPYGSQIHARGGTYGLTGNQTWDRTGGDSSNVTGLKSYTGERAMFNGGRFFLEGSWLRLGSFDKLNAESAVEDNIKIEPGANHLDFDDLLIQGAYRQGVLIHDANYWQFWNCRIVNNGTVANLDHGMYIASTDGIGCVIANALIYDNKAYGIQFYPDCDNVWLVTSTISEHDGNPYAGSIVFGGEASTKSSSNKAIGCLFTFASAEAVHQYLPNGAPPAMNEVQDCMGYGNGSAQEWEQSWNGANGVIYTRVYSDTDPMYVNRSTRNFRLQAGSPAIDLINSSNHGYIPEYDIEGNARASATMGCYAKNTP